MAFWYFTIDDRDYFKLKELWKIVDKWNYEDGYQVVFRIPSVANFVIWEANSDVSLERKTDGQQDGSLSWEH